MEKTKMDFKEYIEEKLNEAEDVSDLAFNNAADVLSDFEEIISRFADIFSAMSVKGNLNASGDVSRALIDIRKKINAANESSKNKDKVFTDEERKSMKTIADNLRDIIEKKVGALAKNVSERMKREQEKEAKKAEKEIPVEEPEPEI
jgi:hypothetical protein